MTGQNPEFHSALLQSLMSFTEGDFFAQEGAIEFSSESALHCLEEILDHHEYDLWLKGSGSIRKYLQTNAVFVDVVAWRRDVVSERDKVHWTEDLVADLREKFEESYTNPDGAGDLLNDHDRLLVKDEVRKLVDLYVSRAKVWQCLPVRSWRLSSVDLLELVEKLRPDWLE